MTLSKLPGLLISVALTAVALNGCSSQTAPAERLPDYSVISVQLPEFKPRQGDQVSWGTDVVIAGAFTDDVKAWAAERVAARVELGFTNRGFTVTQAKDSEYLLFAAVVAGIAEEPLAEQKEILEQIRLYPMLGGDSPYERDMLVLALTTSEKLGDGRPLWKAAVEVYSAYELSLPDDVKRQRLDGAINRLLATLPETNYTY
jgi:hypothetical protein